MRGQGSSPLVAFADRERLVAVDHRPEGLGSATVGEEGFGGADDTQGVVLALFGGVAPGGDAMAAENAADRLRVRLLDCGDVHPELEAGAAPRHPDHAVAEALGCQPLPVGGAGECDAGVGVEVVDVGRLHQAVHGGVDGGGGACLAEGAVVESGNHLVLALNARIDVLQSAKPVEPEHGETVFGQGSQVAA